MWLLRLNNMYSSNIEILENVVVSETRDGLDEFIKNELADEVYRANDGYMKSFKEGSILYDYNPPSFGEHWVYLGTEEDAVNHYHNFINSFVKV